MQDYFLLKVDAYVFYAALIVVFGINQYPSLNPQFKKKIVRASLFIIFLFAVLRLLIYMVYSCQQNLQADFSCYYTAGQSLNRGLSPYINYVAQDPSLWDGVAIYKYSRFIYPPIIGNVFQLFALLPYPLSKFIWLFILLGCLTASLWMSINILEIKKTPELIFILG